MSSLFFLVLLFSPKLLLYNLVGVATFLMFPKLGFSRKKLHPLCWGYHWPSWISSQFNLWIFCWISRNIPLFPLTLHLEIHVFLSIFHRFFILPYSPPRTSNNILVEMLFFWKSHPFYIWCVYTDLLCFLFFIILLIYFSSIKKK